MKVSKVLIALSWLIAILALVAALAGIFYQDGGQIFQLKTLRGETVPIWGQGLYHYDGPIVAVGFMAADGITIVLAIPFLLVSTILYGRASLTGGMLLCGALAYFL